MEVLYLPKRTFRWSARDLCYSWGFFVVLRGPVLVWEGLLHTSEGHVWLKKAIFLAERVECSVLAIFYCYVISGMSFFPLLAIQTHHGKKQVRSGSCFKTHPGEGGQVLSPLVHK